MFVFPSKQNKICSRGTNNNNNNNNKSETSTNYSLSQDNVVQPSLVFWPTKRAPSPFLDPRSSDPRPLSIEHTHTNPFADSRSIKTQHHRTRRRRSGRAEETTHLHLQTRHTLISHTSHTHTYTHTYINTTGIILGASVVDEIRWIFQDTHTSYKEETHIYTPTHTHKRTHHINKRA